MREENKQTENQENSNIMFYYLKKLYTSKVIKLIRNILLNSNTKKIITTILISFIFTLLLIKGATAFDMDEVTYEEIIAAKSNGLISSLCFVQNLLTGNLARAVGAVFILGCGWLFLIGSIKDWKPVLSLTIATTLIFGSAEFAEVISGNDFTCKTIYGTKEKEKEEAIYNDGICKLIDIDTYTIGQKWYVCDSNVTEFSTANCEEVTNATVINSDDKDVFLVTCQSGSYKSDEKVFLRYGCNKDKSIFEIKNSDDKEKGSCIKACTTAQLKEILTSYHTKSTLGESTQNNKFEILNDSGKLKNGAYYTAGTIIDLDCLSGYTELDKDGVANNKGLTAVCTSVDAIAEFKVIGSCRGSCNLNNLSTQYKDTFTEWQKYNKEKNLWEDTKAREFYFEDRVRIKTCDTDNGYRFDITDDPNKTPNSIIPDDEKLIFKCGSGEHNKETWIADNNGKACIRYCNIEDYEFYKEHNWNKDCPLIGNCQTPLTKNELAFKVSEKIGILSCTNTDDYFLNIRGDADRTFLKITCGEDGKWVEGKGLKCQKKCKIENIPFYDYAEKWKVCQTVLNVEETIKECNDLEYSEIDNVIDGDTVQQIVCKKGYGFNNGEGSTFICENGKFKRESGDTDELCMPQCYFNLLGDFDNKSLQWQGSNENGIINQTKEIVDLSTIEENEMSNIREYYTLKSCIKGYEIVNIKNERNDDINNKYTTILCNANNRWEVTKQEVKCNIKKCTFNRETIRRDLESNEYSKNDYEILGLAYVNSLDVFETDSEAKISEVSKEYTITDNSTTQKFNYGTEIKIKTCTTNNNGTYLFGDQDTILKCNSDAKWQIETRSSNNNTKRCKIGICKGSPIDTLGNLTIGTQYNFYSGSIQKSGTFYKQNGDTITNVVSNSFTDFYSVNGSILDASCNTGVEIKFNTDSSKNKSNSNICSYDDNCGNQRDSWNHYYYCDNGTWKIAGGCLKGCYGVPTLKNASIYKGNINYSGIFYNSEGIATSPNTSNINSLYAVYDAILDAACENASYKEVKFGGTCSYSDNCGDKREWGHYYYCDENGIWKDSGSCFAGCANGPTDLIANSDIVSISAGATILDQEGKSIAFNANNLNNVYYGNNTTLNGSCKSGYLTTGEIKYTCVNGSWNKSGGSCNIMCEGLPSNNILVANSNVNDLIFDSNTGITNTINNKTYYSNGSVINGSCNSGYLEAEDIKYTCVNGSWNKSNGSCKASCTTGSVSNGYWKNNANNANVSNSTLSHGTTISMVCSSAYTLAGSSVATCNDGSWNFDSNNGRCRKNGPVNFYFTGGVQTFNPADYGLIAGDVVTLEVWGAQGGSGSNQKNNAGKGGNGGKTTANYIINNKINLYIVIGGQNGYNGGGSTLGRCGINQGIGGVGGGATHISTETGILSENKVHNTVLIVAGGGGGGGEYNGHTGGYGGGNNNNGGKGIENGSGGGYGGEQNKGGDCLKPDGKTKWEERYCLSGSAGKGGDATDGDDSENNWCGGAGGGGWYGGASGDWGRNTYGSGGGGSGFCGNGVTNCDGENGVREGDGMAIISW